MLRHAQAAVTRQKRRETLAADAHVADQENADHRCSTWISLGAHSVSRSNVMVPTAFTSRLLPVALPSVYNPKPELSIVLRQPRV